MTKPFPLTSWLFAAFSMLLFVFWGGCMNSGSNSDNEPLIRVQDRILTVLDFNKAFEIAKTAYPHNSEDEPEEFRNARLRLLNQLVVEMIILERAEELGLSISSDEIQKAVSEIKNDYPEDTFEKALLEFAVSYESWEARLKNRLLMQKVVDNELKNQIAITPQDIASYYERNPQATDTDADSINQTKDINENIIKHLKSLSENIALKSTVPTGKNSAVLNTVKTRSWKTRIQARIQDDYKFA
jgi:hypothetical protein